MTDKRKRRIRNIAAKLDKGHRGAANTLSKTSPNRDAEILLGAGIRNATHIPDRWIRAPISPSALADAYGHFEMHDVHIDRLVLGPEDFVDIRKFGRDIVDLEHDRNVMADGFRGKLWNAGLWLDPRTPSGRIYFHGTQGLSGQRAWGTIHVERTPEPPRQEILYPLIEADLTTLRRIGLNPDKAKRCGDTSTTAPISVAVLSDMFGGLERFGVVTRIEMSPVDYADLRKWGRDIFDMESRTEMLRKGLQGVVWGAEVYCSREVPIGTTYLVARDIVTGQEAFGLMRICRL